MFRDNFPRSREVIWKRMAVLIVLPLLFTAASIAQSQPQSAPDSEGPAPNAPKPLPGLSDPAVSTIPVDDTYIIGANDVLYITVFHEKDYTGPYVVGPDGVITVPLFGEMKAEGLTKRQLGKQLAEMLSEKIRDPEVSVALYEVRSKKYTVTGQVKHPQAFPLIRRTTVFEAITDAGGFLDAFSNQTDILIMRGAQTFHFNFKDYVKGRNRDKNIELQNGDTIYVK
jgi:polysaccharide biosynthesis/export protein